MTRARELRHVRRGAYADPVKEELEPRIAHLELLEATIRQSSPDVVASHMSAAAVHGLPIWKADLDRVELIRNRPGGLKKRRYSRVRGLPLHVGEVVTVDGTVVTSLARTVLDLACALSMQKAVAIGDAALRMGLDQSELDDALERGKGRHGIARARRSIAFLDARSESPGESVSRVIFFEIGVPRPELQRAVYGAAGEVVARCDFDWEGFGTVGEFDGKIKYGRELQPEQEIEDVLFDEKRREDAVRDSGKQVVRWIWADLYPPLELQARLERAFARGRRAA